MTKPKQRMMTESWISLRNQAKLLLKERSREPASLQKAETEHEVEGQ